MYTCKDYLNTMTRKRIEISISMVKLQEPSKIVSLKNYKIDCIFMNEICKMTVNMHLHIYIGNND